MNAQLIKSVDVNGGELVENEFIRVVWQKGFPSQVGVNGCRVQEVLQAAMDRLEEYQNGPLACAENQDAIRHIRAAITCLDERIRRRKEQGVFNTFTPHEAHRTEDEDDDFSATGA